MKKILYTIALSLVSIIAFSQVGVNTTDPKGIFHVDAAGTGTDNGSFIVTSNGNVGIGTLTPTEKLEVNGNMQITLSDKVGGNLTTDNNIIVNGSLRLLGNSTSVRDLDNLTSSQLEIIADTPKTGLRFDNGSQKINDDPVLVEMVPSFSKNAGTDMAGWVNLKSLTDIREANLLNNINIASGAAIDITETTGLTLDEGIWLIMASIPTDTNYRIDNTGGYYVWMCLFQDDASSGTEIIRVGSPTESNGGAANGFGVSTPQLMYLLKVHNNNTTYRIKLSTSAGVGVGANATQYRTNTGYGAPYFFAVKLDYTN